MIIGKSVSKQVIFSFLTFLCVSLSISGSASPLDIINHFSITDGKQIQTSQMVMRFVASGSPQYYFWRNTGGVGTTISVPASEPLDSDKGKGFVKLQAIFEFDDKDDDGIYDSNTESPGANTNVNFASEKWNIGTVTTETLSNDVSGAHFDYNLIGSPSFMVKNHFYSNSSSILKIDFILANYAFSANSSGIKFAMKILLPTEVSAGEIGRYNFASGFFSFTSQAQGSAGLINVTSHLDGNTLYLIYANFGSSLKHDPIIGLAGGSSPIEAVPILMGLVFVGAVAMINKRRNIRGI